MKRYVRCNSQPELSHTSFTADARAILESDGDVRRSVQTALQTLKNRMGLYSNSYDDLYYSNSFLSDAIQRFVQCIQDHTDYSESKNFVLHTANVDTFEHVFYSSKVPEITLFNRCNDMSKADRFTRYEAEAVCKHLNDVKMYGYTSWMVLNTEKDS